MGEISQSGIFQEEKPKTCWNVETAFSPEIGQEFNTLYPATYSPKPTWIERH